MRTRLVLLNGSPETDPVFDTEPEEMAKLLTDRLAESRRLLGVPDEVALDDPSVSSVLSVWDEAGNCWNGDPSEIVRLELVE